MSWFFKTKALHAAAAEVTEMDAAPFDLRNALWPCEFFVNVRGLEAMNRAFLYALPVKTALYSIKAQKNLKILKKYGCKIPAAVSTKRRGQEPPKK